ncbi:hypothetical protein LguiB_013437 [Lonicera macranthoides]
MMPFPNVFLFRTLENYQILVQLYFYLAWLSFSFHSLNISSNQKGKRIKKKRGAKASGIEEIHK